MCLPLSSFLALLLLLTGLLITPVVPSAPSAGSYYSSYQSPIWNASILELEPGPWTLNLTLSCWNDPCELQVSRLHEYGVPWSVSLYSNETLLYPVVSANETFLVRSRGGYGVILTSRPVVTPRFTHSILIERSKMSPWYLTSVGMVAFFLFAVVD
jgi:hypothetical protein